MSDGNKHFVDVELFNQRALSALKARNLTLDGLFNKLNNEIGYTITKNNLSIYLRRPPNTNFLIALCKALNVSSDYLLGITETDVFDSEFDLNFDSRKYKKYEHNNYILYFLETSSNNSLELKKAKLSIQHNVFYNAKLCIKTDEGHYKNYSGEFLLSNTYDIGYMTLKGKEIGEIVHISFYDPIINSEAMSVELFTGAMISVSAGDIKRAPVLSKFIVSRKELDKTNIDAIKANLLLNTKYIEIETENLLLSLKDCFKNSEKKSQIEERIKNAFSQHSYFKLEESYILNTLTKDFKLSKEETNNLLHALRLNSNAKSNYKINQKNDSRLFEIFCK